MAVLMEFVLPCGVKSIKSSGAARQTLAVLFVSLT
jgi:hypothetical protein